MTDEEGKERLMAVGLMINDMMVEARAVLGNVTLEDLQEFRQYAERTETTGPILDPTAYMKLPHGSCERVRKRIEVAKFILEDV